METGMALRAAVPQGAPLAGRPQPLIPAFLIAASINAEGNIDLAARDDGGEGHARIEFGLGREGEVFQRRYRIGAAGRLWSDEPEPLDMVALAESLAYTFGADVPPLFRLAAPEAGRPCRLALPGGERDRERLKVLYDAFSIYLLAYEEHLV